MKKQDVAGLIVYLLILGLGLLYGFTVLRAHASQSSITGWFYVLYILGALLASIVLNAVIIELGHLLGAKAGGYEILSINILGFCFYKKEKGIGFKFSKFNGLTGETKIVPKDIHNSSPRMYLSLGNLFILLESILFVVLFIVFNSLAINNKSLYDLAYFFLTVAMMSALILIYNIMPIELDATNDGYRLRLISDKKNKHALNELLRVEYELSKGNNDVEIETFNEISNFTAKLNLNKVYILLGQEKIEQALEIVDLILNNSTDIAANIYLECKSLKMVIYLIYKDIETAEEFYEKGIGPQENKLISEDRNITCLTSYILTSALFDKSRSECEISLPFVENAYKHAPANKKEVSKSLFNKALDMVITNHPSWDISIYKL